MRLIDKDALLKRMQDDPLFDLVERYGVSGVINAEPTVDAMPLIRCRNCEHHGTRTNMCDIWHRHTNGEGYCHRAKAVKKGDPE